MIVEVLMFLDYTGPGGGPDYPICEGCHRPITGEVVELDLNRDPPKDATDAQLRKRPYCESCAKPLQKLLTAQRQLGGLSFG